jgi:hypothetical protein
MKTMVKEYCKSYAKRHRKFTNNALASLKMVKVTEGFFYMFD